MARLGVATLGKGGAIFGESRLDPNHPWGSEYRLTYVRVSKAILVIVIRTPGRRIGAR